MKSLLSLSVIVPSKSVKKMNLGSLKGRFMAMSGSVEESMMRTVYRIEGCWMSCGHLIQGRYASTDIFDGMRCR